MHPYSLKQLWLITVSWLFISFYFYFHMAVATTCLHVQNANKRKYWKVDWWGTWGPNMSRGKKIVINYFLEMFSYAKENLLCDKCYRELINPKIFRLLKRSGSALSGERHPAKVSLKNRYWSTHPMSPSIFI